MCQQTTNILKKKHLRLELFQEFSIVIEQRSTGIFKTEPFSCIGEALTRCAARKQIEFALLQTEILLQIKAGDICNIIVDNTPFGSVPTERVRCVLVHLYKTKCVKPGFFHTESKTACACEKLNGRECPCFCLCRNVNNITDIAVQHHTYLFKTFKGNRFILPHTSHNIEADT